MNKSNIYQKEDLDAAVRCMRAGGIILYPTDTVWGIGCDATNAEAVAKIFALKQRADAKSMLVLVDGVPALERLIPEIPDAAYDIVELSVSPITIIYDDAMGVAPSLIAEDGSLGVRVTSEVFSRDLCRAMRRPIVSTSANISGMPTPAAFSAISEEIKSGVDYIVQYRQDDKQTTPPSSIIKLGRGGEVKIIR